MKRAHRDGRAFSYSINNNSVLIEGDPIQRPWFTKFVIPVDDIYWVWDQFVAINSLHLQPTNNGLCNIEANRWSDHRPTRAIVQGENISGIMKIIKVMQSMHRRDSVSAFSFDAMFQQADWSEIQIEASLLETPDTQGMMGFI
jgi:hypothetical protein